MDQHLVAPFQFGTKLFHRCQYCLGFRCVVGFSVGAIQFATDVSGMVGTEEDADTSLGVWTAVS